MDFDLADEQKIWQKTVHDFVAKEVQPKAHDVDVTSEFNWEAVRKMGPLGLLSLNIPEQYGGAGVDSVSAALEHTEAASLIADIDPHASITASVDGSSLPYRPADDSQVTSLVDIEGKKDG